MQVPMLSSHVVTYWPARMSYPSISIPSNGAPAMTPECFATRKRPPMIHERSHIPSLVCGSPGPMNIFEVDFHVPTRGSSALCCSPGFAYFIISAIMASSGVGVLALASAFDAGVLFAAFDSAAAVPADTTRQQPSTPQTNLRQNESVQRIMRVSSLIRFGRDQIEDRGE